MKSKKQSIQEEPEYIILDERARVFAGLREGHHFFSEDLDEAKPLQGQSKFEFMQRCVPYFKLEQIFLEKKNGGKKRRN